MNLRSATRPAFFCLALLLSFSPSAASGEEPEVAKVDSAEGTVEVRTGGTGGFRPVKKDEVLRVHDLIHTGKRSRTGLLFVDGVLLRLGENTTLQLEPVDPTTRQQAVDLREGKAHLFSREPKEYPIISSPAVSTAIRGTEVSFAVDGEVTTVTLIEGSAECYNDLGRVALAPGERAVTRKGSAPAKELIANPRDAVQWTLYFPVIVDQGEVGAANDAERALVQRVFAAYEAGDLPGALTLLDGTPKRSPGLEILYANLSLAAGDIESAERALQRASASGAATVVEQAAAQRALIEIVRGDKDGARKTLASVPVDGAPSGSRALVESYFAQANFDLERADSWLRTLGELRPSAGFSFARRAELAMGSGDVEAAEAYLAEAERVAPDDTYVRSVRAFLLLIRNDVEEAQKIFEAVIDRDGARALPHLGLGLALIQQGELAEGRAMLEKAAALEPTTGIYRSYLGKAYFEEEREGMAAKEYERAIELDPRDPTPYLYRAYNNLSQNAVVNALRDVEQSIELNRNRAVYRSSLLLDQDLGVRSAGLAEVFTSLGFDQAARVEAIKSLNHDYGNYSAHRLLGESYSTVETDDAARSERALAEILSPLSFNLFQGPSAEASLNDYNALFNRDQMRHEVGMNASTQDDEISPRASTSGKFGDFGYILGVDSRLLDGSRRNSYERYYVSRGAVQWQPTFEDRFIIGGGGYYRHNEQKNAVYDDIKLEEYEFDGTYVRRLSPSQKFFVQARYQHQGDDFNSSLTEQGAILEEIIGEEAVETEDTLFLDQRNRERLKTFRGTAQHIYDSSLLSLVTGSQIYYSRKEREETSRIIDDQLGAFPGLGQPLLSDATNDVNSYDLYTYSTWHLSEYLDLNAGVALTDVELENTELPPFASDTLTRSRWNPKFGATVYPLDNLTIRAAYFEALRKSSFEDNLTLEPTLVGGINQRLTDFPGDISRNVGVGVDYKWPGSTYVGVEWLDRKINQLSNNGFPVITADYNNGTIGSETIIDQSDGWADGESLRAYLYQVFTPELVGTVDYQYALSEVYVSDGNPRTQVQKIGNSLRYFHGGGWFTFVTGTWREQNRDNNVFIDNGTNDFWLFDAGVGYRVPERHGSVVFKLSNIFDEDFTYDQSFGVEEPVYPGIYGSLVATVNF